MRRSMFAVAVAVAAVLAAPAGLGAQRLLSFGVAGGPTFPVGSGASEFDTGFNVGVFAELNVPLLPVGARGDLLFHQISEPGHGDLQVVGLTGNGKLLLPSPLFSPYLIGGVGLYMSRFEDIAHADQDDSWSTNAGVNGGVGVQLRLVRLNAFVETRLQYVFGWDDHTPRILPVTFGVSF